MGKNIGKNIRINLCSKYDQKFLDRANQSPTDAIKTSSKRVIQKATKATCDLIGNKTAKKITKVPKNLQQNNLETIANENDKEIPKERYMPPEKRQETFDDLRLK